VNPEAKKKSKRTAKKPKFVNWLCLLDQTVPRFPVATNTNALSVVTKRAHYGNLGPCDIPS
jgi:hypothetical protein